MTAQQFDLFGEMEAQEQHHADCERRRREIPPVCPSCATRERSHWHLTLNHGYDLVRDGEHAGIADFPRYLHPIFGRYCTAQHLTRNHIIYALQHRDSALLDAAVTRANQLRLDAETIIANTLIE